MLRVPILFPHHHHLAAEALSEAARLLQSTGQTDGAQRLLQELIRDYPDTAVAQHARQQMQ
jgi:TolA-binding protein